MMRIRRWIAITIYVFVQQDLFGACFFSLNAKRWQDTPKFPSVCFFLHDVAYIFVYIPMDIQNVYI